jgi:ABC-type multidrug transport system fused ATPase/permease subunit
MITSLADIVRWTFRSILSPAQAILSFIALYSELNRDNERVYETLSGYQSIEKSANWLSRILFLWANSKCIQVALQFDENWDEVTSFHKYFYSQPQSSRSVLRAVVYATLWSTLISFALKVAHIALSFMPTLLLLNWVTSIDPHHNTQVFAALACLFFRSLVSHHYFHICSRIGIFATSAIISLPRANATCLNRPDISASYLDTLLQDAPALGRCVPSFHSLWAFPLIVMISLSILLNNTESIPISNVASVMFFVVFLIAITNRYFKNYREVLVARMHRILAMRKALEIIRIVKLCAWEKLILTEVDSARSRERSALRRQDLLRAAFLLISFILCSSLLYIVLEPSLRTLVLFGLVPPLLSSFMSIMDVIQGKVILDRIHTIIRSLESPILDNFTGASYLPGLHLEHAQGRPETSACIQTFDLTWSSGELIGIVGQTGSGKSLFLSTTSGGTPHLKNKSENAPFEACFIGDHITTPNCSIREYIVNQRPWNELWYYQVLRAGGLEHLRNEIPQGDDFPICEGVRD